MAAQGPEASGGPALRRPMSVLAAAGWALAAAIGVDLAVTLTDSARPGAAGDLVNVTTCHLAVYVLLVFVLLRVYEPTSSVRAVLGLRPTTPWAYLLAIPIGAGVYPTLSLLDEMVARRWPMPEDESALLDQLTDTHALAQRIALFVAFVVVIPISEEVLFRGVLFGAIKVGRTLFSAVMISTVLALLVHEDLRTLGSTLTLALLFSWLRAHSGSTWPSCLAHASFFGVPAVRLVLQPGAEDDFSLRVRIGAAVVAVVALSALALTLRRAPRAVLARLADG